jgi:hypothetical protein
MTLKTTNVTFGNFLSVDEVLLYKPDPTDSSRTLLQQQATVSVEGVPLSRYMEEVLTNNISFNASRGRLGLEWVINKINTEVSQPSDNKMTKINSQKLFPQVKEIATTADDLLTQTKKSIDGITDSARKSMDELSTSHQKIHI